MDKPEGNTLKVTSRWKVLNEACWKARRDCESIEDSEEARKILIEAWEPYVEFLRDASRNHELPKSLRYDFGDEARTAYTCIRAMKDDAIMNSEYNGGVNNPFFCYLAAKCRKEREVQQ